MRHFLTICAFLLLALPVVAQERPVKVGALLCLTGDCAEWGDNSLKGVQLAVGELNRAGGVNGRTFELVVEDSQEMKAGWAVTAFKKLTLDSEISCIIGPSWTPAGLALAPLAAKNSNVIVISPSLSVKDFHEAGENLFNSMPPEELLTERVAKYAIEKGWKRVAIFGSQHPATKAQTEAFRRVFEAAGGEIVAVVEPIPESTSLKTEALKIVRSKPDGVFISYWAGLAAKELKRLGYNGPIVTRQMDEQRLSSSSGGLEGAVFPKLPGASAAFVEKFKKAYSKAPGVSADTAYDAMRAYAKAAEEAGSFNIKGIQSKMLSVDFDGASGKVRFDPQGGRLGTPGLRQVVGSKFVNLSE